MKVITEKTEKLLIETQLREAQELIKCTPLEFPDREPLLGLVNAAIALLIDGSAKTPDLPEYLLHLEDALRGARVPDR
jgi:hypothetical protein